MADKRLSVKIWLAAVCILCILLPGKVLAAEDEAVNAAEGIIEVQSGFLDETGQFWKMKSASGFLIANDADSTYIVTNCRTVSNTPRSIKKYCEKKSIKTGNTQLTNYIQVVVEGDVTAQAEVVVKSAEKDYCVLSAANVVSQKESLKLGDSAGIAVNDPVYAYGFPKQTDAQTDPYTVRQAQAIRGAVTQAEAYLDSGTYIAHSAPVKQGYAGGPLLDADGYVIGMNCKQSPEDDTGIAYALPVNEISEVLDNFSIYYGSRAIDESYEQLKNAYDACEKLSEAGGYKKASMETLQQALTEAGQAMEQEEPVAAELQEAYQTLTAAKDGLTPKTKPLTVIIMILPVFIVLLFIWAIVLGVKNAEEKKMMNVMQHPLSGQADQQNIPFQGQPGMQNGYAGQPGIQAGYTDQTSYIGQTGMPNAAYQNRPVLQPVQQKQPAAPPTRRLRVIRQKTGQTVMVNKNQFVIGKSQTQADFCIADNQTVSRKHAILFENNGGWYIDDLNSLNGTYLNGKKLTAGQAAVLKDGDEILLSDESFLVQG